MVFRSASELKARRPRARWLAAAKALAMLLVRVHGNTARFLWLGELHFYK
jgi:hypothetical protein